MREQANRLVYMGYTHRVDPLKIFKTPCGCPGISGYTYPAGFQIFTGKNMSPRKISSNSKSTPIAQVVTRTVMTQVQTLRSNGEIDTTYKINTETRGKSSNQLLAQHENGAKQFIAQQLLNH